MPTNERLFAAGLVDEFDAAAKMLNRKAMVDILIRVEFEVDEAARIVDAFLADPKYVWLP